MDVLLPTLAVVLVWACAGVVLAGCGFLTRFAVIGLVTGARPDRLAVVDLWLGLAALFAYLQVWSLFLAVSRLAWVAPAVLGLVGIAAGARRPRRVAVPWSTAAIAGLGTLWLANRALASSADYDLELYHRGAIRYALEYPAIPGLGNLHDRLGAGNAHFLLGAFFERGPWGGAGLHFVNGLLVALLFVECCSRLTGGASFARRMAALLVPAAVVVAGLHPEWRISSPNLDLAVFVLVVVGALYLVDYVERDRQAAAAAATALFTLAAVTRPLYWLFAAVAAGVVVVVAHRRGRGLRVATLACVLPGALLAGWIGRNAILSGYPFFPLTTAGLPVDWRMPSGAVHDLNERIGSWARWPRKSPDEVGGISHWLPHWLTMQRRNADAAAPLILLVAVLPWLVRGGRRSNMPAMLAVIVPSAVTLVAWFPIAPDPRFAFAPIWLVPVSLAAWALPSPLQTAAKAALAAAGVGAAALVIRVGAFGVVVSDHSGTLGTIHPATPAVVPFTTSSGLKIFHPEAGDQCWQVPLCTPSPKRALQLRGRTIRDGFSVR